MEDDSKKPELAEPNEEPAKTEEARPSEAKSEEATASGSKEEAKPESTKEPAPPLLVHPPPGPPPPTSIRLLKSIGTVVAIFAILGAVTGILRYLGRDSTPVVETADPVDTSHLDDPPPPLSTIPTPFGIDDLDANAPFVPDDDTRDAAAEFKAFMKHDAGRHTGHRSHEAGTAVDDE